MAPTTLGTVSKEEVKSCYHKMDITDQLSALCLLINVPLFTVAVSRDGRPGSTTLLRCIAALATVGLLVAVFIDERKPWLTIVALLDQLLCSTGGRARIPGDFKFVLRVLPQAVSVLPEVIMVLEETQPVMVCALAAVYFLGGDELRRSAGFAIGRADGGPLVCAALCFVLSTSALVGWSILWVKSAHGPIDRTLGPVLSRANFAPLAALNAVREEMEFRMLLMGGLLSSPWGEARAMWWIGAVVLLQAAYFAVLHVAGGFPSGTMGGGLVFLWGIFLGILRVWTGGMGLVMCLHFQADVVIFLLVLSAFRRRKGRKARKKKKAN